MESNLGAVLAGSNRLPEAVVHYQRAAGPRALDPDVHYNLGLALQGLGQPQAAAAQLAEAERLRRP